LTWLCDESFDLDLIGFDATELERSLALADGEAGSDDVEDEFPSRPRIRSQCRATSGSWATIVCCAVTHGADVEQHSTRRLATLRSTPNKARWRSVG
jgi:hypothetical protein